MTDIDWSKAPEGATHYFAPFFYRVEGLRMYLFATSWEPSAYSSRQMDRLGVKRPPLNQPWPGDGLPPVGTVCDVTPHNTIWGFSVVDTYGCTVLAYHDDFVWVDIGTPGVPVATRIDKVDFAPIKTPAQIAAEEREAAIDEMAGWAGLTGLPIDLERKILGRLYDGNYRRMTKGDDK